MMNPLRTNTSDNSLYLDANILIEILLGREKELEARKLLESWKGDLYISSLTAHLVVHFGRVIAEFSVLRKFLADYTILSVESSDIEWAFMNIRGLDFEDALQLAVAVRHGCTQLVSLDSTFVSLYRDLPSIRIRLLK